MISSLTEIRMLLSTNTISQTENEALRNKKKIL